MNIIASQWITKDDPLTFTVLKPFISTLLVFSSRINSSMQINHCFAGAIRFLVVLEMVYLIFA
jgi:hypothetical protein